MSNLTEYTTAGPISFTDFYQFQKDMETHTNKKLHL
jgi:hypothetical protein